MSAVCIVPYVLAAMTVSFNAIMSFDCFSFPSFRTIKIIVHCNIYFLFSVMFCLHKRIFKITEGEKDPANQQMFIMFFSLSLNGVQALILATRPGIHSYC